MSAVHWHPMIVHFPLALVLTAAACLIASHFVRRANLAHSLAIAGTWNLSLGAVSVLIAAGSGFAAAMQPHESAAPTMSAHMSWAIFSGLSILSLAIFRAAGRGANIRPTRRFLLLLSVASLALIITGFYGGENVYRFGLGVLGHP
jgi:uncharacterized membrane protein